MDAARLCSRPHRVRARFRSQLPEFIWDAAALEGKPYTLPEVQTLLEGVSVSGHKLEDQRQTLALNDGYNLLDQMVLDGSFALDTPTSDRLHGLVAVHEALDAGSFRGEGASGGGGLVSLGAHRTYQASAAGEGGETLRREHLDLLDYLETVVDPRERSLAYFAAATRRQFYFDGNKRTSRLMMTGGLIVNRFDAISISANRRLEFNAYLVDLFISRDATTLMRFIIDSRSAA